MRRCLMNRNPPSQRFRKFIPATHACQREGIARDHAEQTGWPWWQCCRRCAGSGVLPSFPPDLVPAALGSMFLRWEST